MTQGNQPSNPLSRILRSATVGGLVAIVGLVLMFYEFRSDELAAERQLANQATQIAKQDEQIALNAEQNRLLAELATIAAQEAIIEEQLRTPLPTNNADFAPTATTLAIQSIQIEATRQAIEDKQQQIEATQTTIAQPPPANEIKLLYEDTFDSSSGWNVEEGMKIENGNLIVYHGYDAVPKNPVPYTDFTFESRFHIPASGSMAFYLRHQRPACKDWNCSIQLALYYDKGKNYHEVAARRFLGDKPGQQIDIIKNTAVSALRPDQWNKIVILTKGSDYEVYINDVSVLDFSDGTYTSGSFVVDNAGPNEIKIDYIRVYAVR